MKTLILKNIVSSNTVYQLNQYIKKNKKNLGQVQVLFCAQTEGNRHWKLNEKPNFQYKVLPNFSIKLQGKDLFTYFVNPSIIKEIGQYQPDRIIISGWDLFTYQLSFVWGKLNKKHITLWSGSTKHEKSWRRSLTLPLVKLFISWANDYIAYGTRAKEYLVGLGASPKKVKIFLNSVNLKRFPKQKTKPKNLIFVGQLIQRKGILDLLSAYQMFKKTNPSWGLTIVGTGQLLPQIKQIIAKKKLKDIKLIGHTEQYQLSKIYATASILVLPSHQEVWGLVVNEALHSGLKVVVGDKCGCAPDLVKQGKNGYVFKSGSVSSLASTLQQAVNQQPFFSIITCTKNMTDFVKKNISSVQTQTFKDLEHIFIDGYSKDNTLKIIKKYRQQSNRPVIIHQTKPQGISHAMNLGIKKANGRYLIHLHADDYFYNKKVLVHAFNFLTQHPNLNWVYSQIQTVEKNGSALGVFPKHKVLQKAYPWLLSYTNFIPHQAVFIKKQVFNNHGLFNKNLTSKMDLDLWLRIRNKTNWAFFPEIVSCFTIHSGAQSSSKKFLNQNLKNLDQVLKKHLSKPTQILACFLNWIQLKLNKVLR